MLLMLRAAASAKPPVMHGLSWGPRVSGNDGLPTRRAARQVLRQPHDLLPTGWGRYPQASQLCAYRNSSVHDGTPEMLNVGDTMTLSKKILAGG